MTELINPIAEKYAATYTTETDELLQEIERYTYQNHPESHMLSGPVQGKLLELLSKMLQPKNILEIGTFMGYSALCLAKGLVPGGQLHTLEINQADADIASSFFSKSLHAKQIILHAGNALDIIPTLPNQWDLIFIDADKVNYTNYYEATLPQLKPGGFMLADNVLFHGEVLEDTITGKSAKAIHAFNEHLKKDTRTEHVLMTVRDGLMIIRKK